MSDIRESVITYDHFKLLKEWLETNILKDCPEEQLKFLVFNIIDLDDKSWNLHINVGITKSDN